jgi:acetyltransferase EpsM
MTPTRLVLIGGGEHARVVAEAARSSGQFQVLGFVDRLPCEETTRRLNLPRLGDDDALAQLEAFAVLGVGTVGLGAARRGIVARLGPQVRGWAPVVHAAAHVSPTAEVGEGAVVMAGAVLNSGARIGRHCVVNTGAVVEHDVVMGDFAQLAPGAIVGGGSVIGAGAFLGLGAHIRDHVSVGADAMVTMGAVVTRDVPDAGRVDGPVRHHRDPDGRATAP